MGNQNPKPQLSAKKNVSGIKEKNVSQGQQLTFAKVKKTKFLHQIYLSPITDKAWRLSQVDEDRGKDWIPFKQYEDEIVPARINKIIRIYRLYHHPMNPSTKFGVDHMVGLEQFKLKDFSNMKSVFFYFSTSWKSENSEIIRQFGMNVRNNLPHLRKLHLYFDNYVIIEEKELRSFISELGKSVQLTDFKLVLKKVMRQENEQNLRELFIVICKSHSSLEKLTVKQKGYPSLTDEVLVAFGHHINRHLLKLKQLNLWFKAEIFGIESITDNGLIGFFENFTKNKRGLNHLALRFESFRSITAHKFNRFESQLLQAFPDLQKLSLGFSRCRKFTLNEDEEQIELEKPSNVTSLELDLCGSGQIISSRLKSLTRQIVKDFPLLQELTLNLAGCESIVGWNSALATNEWSEKLTALRSLNLNLKKCEWFNDMNLESLAIDIRNGFSGLESLSLNLSGCKHRGSSFTDNNLESLSSAISSSHQNLKQLTLVFARCLISTDKGFQTLISNISELKELKSLSLNFRQHNFTDQSLESLSSSLSSSLNNLNQLSLNFGEGKYITDRGFQMLFSTIRKMKTLTDLQISFAECEGLTNKILPIVESVLVQNDFANAHQVCIDFLNCSNINKHEKKRQLEKLGYDFKIRMRFSYY